MQNNTEEIKARVDIIDLVQEYIRLKPAGTNNWRGLCPFHNEKTPSFMVSRDKQIFHCFGCGEGGDIFTFVQKMEGVEFPEALRILAEKAGIKLEHQDPKLTSQKNRLMEACKLASLYWHKILLESRQGQKARDYLRQRGVKESTIEDFHIGYAPESWDVMTKFLKSRGFSDQEIFLAGLSVKKERGSDYYDRFRDRVMFPINDMHGSPIGFSGRTLNPNEKMGKYINTPQTLIYNKSLVIFNLDKAKQEIKKQDLAVIVEGQMDAISVFEAGTKNVIASSGTAFTEDQIRILKRYTNNLAMSFDMDAAGENAAKRGIDLALANEMNVKVIVLPSGKDPDECVKRNPQEWFESLNNAKTVMEYYFEKTFGKYDMASAEGKKSAAKIILPVIARMSNKIEQTHWLQKLADNLGVTENILREAMPGRQKGNSNRPAQPIKAIIRTTDRKTLIDQRILGIVFKYPQFISILIDGVSPEVIVEASLNQLYKKLILYYTKDINGSSQNFNYESFRNLLKNDNLDQLADKLVLLTEKDFFDFDQDTIAAELSAAIVNGKRDYYNNYLKDLQEKIKQAEIGKNQKDLENLLSEFNRIVGLINSLE